ncbi:MAG: 50S ribosomal protein L9 [Dongiaceae bacterium]|jgi:large subunit ribosomal protein L9
MDVILLQRIEKLGQMGEVVKVKPGFARNYLLPQKKALRATEANRARFETQRAQLEATNLARRQEAEKISGKVDGLAVVIIRQAGETGHLYGSVSARDVAVAVTAGGVTIDRAQVLMDRPIKMLGLHPVRVALHPEVVVTVTANVAKSAEEAELQKKAGGFIPPTTEGGPTLDEMIAAAEEVIGDAGDGEAPAEAEAAPEAKPEKEKKPKAEKKAKKKKKGDEEEDED